MAQPGQPLNHSDHDRLHDIVDEAAAAKHLVHKSRDSAPVTPHQFRLGILVSLLGSCDQRSNFREFRLPLVAAGVDAPVGASRRGGVRRRVGWNRKA